MKTSAKTLEIPSLDGLRCAAILIVFASHVQMATDALRFIPGAFGVTLFFFLSGYLITTLLRLEIERTGTISIGFFYLRRSLRIFPTCYLVLALAAAYGWYSGALSPWWLLGQVVHLTNYQIISGGWLAPIAPNTDVYWSLAVEEHFYLAFPLLFLGLARVASRPACVAALLSLCALVLAWRGWLVFGLEVPYDRTYLGTDTRIDSILFGCVLALWGNPALDPTRIRESAWKYRLLPLSLLVLLLTLAIGDRILRQFAGYTIQGLCLVSLFVVAVRYPDWGPMRVLNYPVVQWLGRLSFAIYLVHPSMIHLSEYLVGKALTPLLPTAIVLTLSSAAFLYYAIERPLGRVRSRFNAVSRTAAATVGNSAGARPQGEGKA